MMFFVVVKVSKDSILQEILTADEKSYDFCLCNPPFFENIDDIRKKRPKIKEKIETFAKKEEIFSEGGETSFVKQMIKDSLQFRDRISLYTSMFGKKKSYIEILKELHTIKDVTYTKTEFCQGNTIRWGIAWTFLKSVHFLQFEKAKSKPKKAKPPLVHSILRKSENGSTASVEQILERINEILLELEIFSKLIKCAENYAEVQITSNKNTWSHQRRKRREELKSKKKNSTTNKNNETSPQTDVSMLDLNDAASETENKFNETIKNAKGEDSQITVSVTNKTDVKESIDNPNDSLSSTKSEFSVISKGENIYQPDDTQSVIASFNVSNDVGISDQSLSNPDDSEQTSVSGKWKNNDESKTCKNVLEINAEHKHSEDSADKLSEDNASNKCKRKSDWETSPKKKIKLAPIELDIKNDNESVSSEGIPLLFSTIKLRKTKEHILLEMNCPPECNRDSMHQIFQLFKNKFT
ncbi:RNA N6-adenosine-methyltransferase mettl16 [Trichonephila clavata]|uniref:RNA N6-adenosine-methyltransferase mettl16 n=1 Tax=Trichonephila clavata TaxID=2740835 RepID=A0A8X6K5T7_TRICU|nr:RNA N6-adenosine-methyltransferase mettl16 [Trichonephila clavata]